MKIPITCGVDFIVSVLLEWEDMLPKLASLYAISKLDCGHLARMFYSDGVQTRDSVHISDVVRANTNRIWS